MTRQLAFGPYEVAEKHYVLGNNRLGRCLRHCGLQLLLLASVVALLAMTTLFYAMDNKVL